MATHTKRERYANATTFLEDQGCSDECSNWLLLMDPKQIQTCVQKVATKLNSHFKNRGEAVVFVCIMKGVFMFMSDLLRLLEFPLSVYALNVSSYQGQEQKAVQISKELDPSKFVEKTVVVLDELLDHGTTLEEVVSYLTKEVKVQKIFTCVLYSKNYPQCKVVPDFIGYKNLPNVWLVGYGLDDQGEKRNWTSLWGVPKPPNAELGPDDLMFQSNEFYLEIVDEISRRVLTE